MRSKLKKETIIGIFLVLGMIVFVALTTAMPILKQVERAQGDFVSHIKYAKIDFFSGENPITYPLWHMTVQLLSWVMEIEWAAIVATCLFNLLTAGVVIELLQKVAQLDKVKACIFCVSLMVCGPLYVPAVSTRYYIGQLTANVWHNPTNIAVKGMAVIATFMLYRAIWEYAEIKGYKFYIVLAIVLATSVLTKPTYAQIVYPTLVIVYAWKIIRKTIDWKSMWKIFISTLPSGVIILMQYSGIWVEGAAAGGIGIGLFEVWGYYSKNILGSFVISLAFPMLLILLRGKQYWLNNRNVFIFTMFVVALAEYSFLFEDGKRKNGGNFGWGQQLAMFILFLNSVLELRSWKNEWNDGKGIKIQKVKYIACCVAFSLHVICGMGYWLWLVTKATRQC